MINLFRKNLIFFPLVFFVSFVFFGLNWGSPFFFHPDERNIASSISQLNLLANMNPNFFAYGSLPIYSIYIAGLVNNFLQEPFSFNNYNVSFEDAIIIGRLFSAFFSVLMIFLIYKITKDLSNKTAANLSLLLSTLSVGYLQYSHFATFEMWLSFFYLLLFYLTYLFLKTNNKKYFFLASFVFGASVAIKISSLVLIILPIISVLNISFIQKKYLSKIITFAGSLFIFVYLSFLTFFATNPFVLLDTNAFIKSMNYESSVALGTLPVFYTESFRDTVPILYQYAKIMPFLINPAILLLSTAALIFFVFQSIKTRNKYFLLLSITFLLIFVSQSILFVKWTRYIIPSISFLYIMAAILIVKMKEWFPSKIHKLIITFIILISFLFAFSFIKTVRLSPDTRIEAAEFTNINIKRDVSIISEVYDMGIVPFNKYLNNIILFNFYDLEHDYQKINELEHLLNNQEYIILPSTRIVRSRLSNPENFPEGNSFYSNLIQEKLPFKTVYETPCDIFCKITYLGNPTYNVEETANIFDRPTIYIFKKN